MKTIIPLAAALFIGAMTTTTKACDKAAVTHCAPAYVCTKEVNRHTECQWTTDCCGHRVRHELTVVTFVDLYSDGSTRRFARTFPA